ncbi:hypothetical protein [uncultured Porphyromonas sp.]|mgnify:FL=1|uniref:hypothetical protein n=1 Tax=uncultured Porphyromonas sp. TaxID=159274 RepID=UPI0026334321|nr:hypothetical protein [uncultured Porphyromonas sp.]
MSVNLSLILPNECYDIWDNALATKVFYKKIEEIAEYFGGRETFVENICIHNSDSPDWGRFRTSSEDPEDLLEYSFELPLIHATCLLRQGYWDIWIMSRYSTYFWPYSVDINGHIRSWPREDAFDVARIFGFSEGWICDEYHSWNSLLDEDPNASFEKWCAYGDSIEDAQVHEFDLSIFKGRMEQVLDYHPKYHDLFSECHALVATLEQKYPDYKILSLNRPKNWVLTAKGKELYVLDPTTGECLTPFPIDCCHANFNGAGFSVSKGEERAFFNRQGKQLTEFRKGGFRWSWAEGLGLSTIVIKDEASGRLFLSDGTEVPPDQQN